LWKMVDDKDILLGDGPFGHFRRLSSSSRNISRRILYRLPLGQYATTPSIYGFSFMKKFRNPLYDRSDISTMGVM